jgi:hypothetical protein
MVNKVIAAIFGLLLLRIAGGMFMYVTVRGAVKQAKAEQAKAAAPAAP